MRKSLILAIALLVAGNAFAAPVSYKIDPNHTEVIAGWSHFGFSTPTARFSQIEGVLVYDADKIPKSSVNVKLPLAGLNSGIPDLDEHLRSADFFDAATYPSVTFVSTKVEAAGEGKLRVTGDLTLHGVTKPVVLDATLNKAGEHPLGKRAAIGFDASTTIKRSEFGIDKYVPNVKAQAFLGLGGRVTGLEVKTRDIYEAAEIAKKIKDKLGFPYWTKDWMRMNKNLFSALKLEKTMMFLLLVLITIVASFNIVSTLTMIVTEKQKEIAILKAMGATRKSSRRIFMLNGLIIGFSGTAIEIPLGYAFLWLIQTLWTFDPTVYYISRIPVHVQALDVLLVAGSAILISFAATVYPSLQAAKLEPVAALRYQRAPRLPQRPARTIR